MLDILAMSSGDMLLIMELAILIISGLIWGTPAVLPPIDSIIACSCSGGMLRIISLAILAISGVISGMPPAPPGIGKFEGEDPAVAGCCCCCCCCSCCCCGGAAALLEMTAEGVEAEGWDGGGGAVLPCLWAACAAMAWIWSGGMVLNDSAAMRAISGDTGAPLSLAICASWSGSILEIMLLTSEIILGLACIRRVASAMA
mmetsp:Transcript_27988/g.75574  ORF Transcript_27988/g.75574 Transcript_27988/m.75574 type:complete len:201 (+) Transcript_27988:973-1575(+)